MRRYTTLSYSDNEYNVCTESDDPSGQGCIREIIKKDSYKLFKFKNKKSSFIDIGANCGLATIILAKQNPDSIVYSFEPHLATFNLLNENIRINEIKNVKTFNLAVSDSSDKKLTLLNHPDYSGGNTTCSDISSFKSYFKNEVSGDTVTTVSFDDIISKHSIDSVELLKIDCEGAEYEILYSSALFKNKIVKNIVGEFHNLKYNINAENNIGSLVKYCKQHVDGIHEITKLTL